MHHSELTEIQEYLLRYEAIHGKSCNTETEKFHCCTC